MYMKNEILTIQSSEMPTELSINDIKVVTINLTNNKETSNYSINKISTSRKIMVFLDSSFVVEITFSI